MVAAPSPFPSHLSPSDSLMWRIEQDPVLRSAIVTIGVLDREPDWPSVRATLERAVEKVPRLRQRIESTGFGIDRLRWVDDPTFSLDYHLRRVRAPEPGDLRTVLDLAAPDAAAALDPARPLWQCTVVEGLEDQRAAFILRFHHTVADGIGSIDLAGSIFDRTRDGALLDERPASPASAGHNGLEQAIDLVTTALGSLVRPRRTAGDAVRTVRSIGRMLAPAPQALSPVLVGRGLNRRLDTLQRPLADLRRAAAAVESTINEVFLGAVAGALYDYHERLGHPVPALRFAMPVNVRAEGDPPGGNHFTPVRFTLRVDERDPARRVGLARAATRRWRHDPAVQLTPVLAAALDRLPQAAVTGLFGAMLKNVDADVVDVPGLSRPAYIGGAEIQQLWGFAPPTGAALSVTLLSHVDIACVGVVADTAAVSDPDLLVACLEHSFDAVIGLIAVDAPPGEETPHPGSKANRARS